MHGSNPADEDLRLTLPCDRPSANNLELELIKKRNNQTLFRPNPRGKNIHLGFNTCKRDAVIMSLVLPSL